MELTGGCSDHPDRPFGSPIALTDIAVLQLFPNPALERRRKTRWGWLVVSMGLLAGAGYFLYPSVENLTELKSELESAYSTPAPELDKVVRPDTEAPVERPAVKPVRTVARAMAPAKPIRQVAPVAAVSVRNRIVDEIPVYVTMRIGANGSVVGAQAATAGDGVHAYLAQRALEAARQWKFRPAMLGAEAVPSKWTVRFQFQKSGVLWN